MQKDEQDDSVYNLYLSLTTYNYHTTYVSMLGISGYHIFTANRKTNIGLMMTELWWSNQGRYFDN